MSYQVLARKWRPKNFHEMVGQTHVLRALINALDENRLHHAYLFTGTRGVGKTTVARIFAKSLNCDEGISSNPCGVCAACQEINDGRFVDLIEVDAASRTKVEDTREILENVQYAPTRGRYKVYLIDEVHMLSKSSFNALLKTLEEPPEHVKFLLATTDPQKLPMTVLSRCLNFSLKNMSVEMIVGHLENVLTAEQIEFQTPALWQLAKAAKGSMRDAMSLTDQSIAFGQGKIITTDVNDMLGNVDSSQVQQIVRLLLQVDASGLLSLINQIADHAPDYLNLLQEVVAYFHTLAIAQMAPSALNNALYNNEYLLELAKSTTAEHVQLCYQLALQSTSDLKISPDGKVGFEMAMMRIMAFSDQPVVGELPQLPNSNASESTNQTQSSEQVESSPKPLAHSEEPISSPNKPLVDEVESKQVESIQEKTEELESKAPVEIEEVQSESTQLSSKQEELPAQQIEQKEANSDQIEPAQIVEPQVASQVTQSQIHTSQTASSQIDVQETDLPFSPDVSEHVVLENNISEEIVNEPNYEDLSNDVDDQALLNEPLIHSDDWIEAFAKLDLKGLLGSIFSNAQWVENDSNIEFVICEQHERLFNPTHLEAMKQKLNESGLTSQKPISVRFGQVNQTPYVFQTQRKTIKKKRANIEFAAHDIVKYLKEQFSASVLTETVTPIT